jgi:hypothetical protein
MAVGEQVLVGQVQRELDPAVQAPVAVAFVEPVGVISQCPSRVWPGCARPPTPGPGVDRRSVGRPGSGVAVVADRNMGSGPGQELQGLFGGEHVDDEVGGGV